MGKWEILDLRDIAQEWRDAIAEMSASVPGTEGMSYGEVETAIAAFLDEPEQLEHVAKYRDLCAELGIDATPDALDSWANDYDPALIHEDYFTQYAQDLAEDIGAIDANAAWPLAHIDWEGAARDLRMDYTAVEFDGDTYYLRA